MIAVVVLMAALIGSPAQEKPAPVTTVTGKWSVTLEMQSGTASPTLDLKQDGEKISGFYEGRYGKFPLTGTLKARKIEFSFKMSAEGTDVVMAYSGDVGADFLSMKGLAQLDQMGEASWSAKRVEK